MRKITEQMRQFVKPLIFQDKSPVGRIVLQQIQLRSPDDPLINLMLEDKGIPKLVRAEDLDDLFRRIDEALQEE